MRMTQTALAEKMSVPLQRVNTLINGKRAVTADTALLLSEIFDTSPEFGMNLQAQCDLYDPRRRRDANRREGRTALIVKLLVDPFAAARDAATLCDRATVERTGRHAPRKAPTPDTLLRSVRGILA